MKVGGANLAAVSIDRSEIASASPLVTDLLVVDFFSSLAYFMMSVLP